VRNELGDESETGSRSVTSNAWAQTASSARPDLTNSPSTDTMTIEDPPDAAMPFPDLLTSERQLDADDLGDHIDRLYRAAWSLCGSREDAEDLVQETFARVLRRPRFIRSDQDLGYLLQALRNTFISGRRTAARRPRETPMPEDFDTPDTRVFAIPEASVDMADLYAAIAQLPQSFRDAVVAVDVAGLSYREAARRLHVREATLTTRVHRGRRRLADNLRIA
jgi:RNA polymerase sigma-70 factor (ECF subfamily)